MTYQSGQTNSGPPRRSTGGGGGASGILSMPEAALNNCLWVQTTTSVYVADGSVQYPFTSIDAAVNAAALLFPTASNPVGIVVMPGYYAENVVLDTDYVYLFGWDRETTIVAGAPALNVTSEYTAVWGLTLRMPNGAGIPVQVNTGSSTVFVEFNECAFDKTGLVDYGSTAVVISDAAVRFIDCQFLNQGHDEVVLRLSGFITGTIAELWDCLLDGAIAQGGIDDLYVYRCDITGWITSATVGALFVFDSRVVTDTGSAIRISDAAQMELKDNYLESAAQNKDVWAAGAVTGVVIENNVMMSEGIHSNVSHLNPVKWVGSAGNRDFYKTTQEALTACTYDDCVVKLLKDEVLAGAITPPARPVTVDGNGKHTISLPGAGTIWTGVANCAFTFKDIRLVGRVSATGAGCVLRLHNSEINTGVLTLDSTSTVYVVDSYIKGDGVYGAAAFLLSADSVLVVIRSYLKGTTASTAVMFYAVNNNLKIAYSTIWHGSGGANNPFGRSAAQVITWRGAHNAFNIDPDSFGWSTNLVAAGQQQSTFDVQSDY